MLILGVDVGSVELLGLLGTAASCYTAVVEVRRRREAKALARIGPCCRVPNDLPYRMRIAMYRSWNQHTADTAQRVGPSHDVGDQCGDNKSITNTLASSLDATTIVADAYLACAIEYRKGGMARLRLRFMFGRTLERQVLLQTIEALRPNEGLAPVPVLA